MGEMIVTASDSGVQILVRQYPSDGLMQELAGVLARYALRRLASGEQSIVEETDNENCAAINEPA